ncbi:hypothetical protein A2U01_0065157, partial [Trifolium medium]|nr:hypothetical protein [Trifolium medium]
FVQDDLGWGKNCVPLGGMKVLSGAGYKEEGSTIAPTPTAAGTADISSKG